MKTNQIETIQNFEPHYCYKNYNFQLLHKKNNSKF